LTGRLHGSNATALEYWATRSSGVTTSVNAAAPRLNA
jgi:hypothetical protein